MQRSVTATRPLLVVDSVPFDKFMYNEYLRKTGDISLIA